MSVVFTTWCSLSFRFVFRKLCHDLGKARQTSWYFAGGLFLRLFSFPSTPYIVLFFNQFESLSSHQTSMGFVQHLKNAV